MPHDVVCPKIKHRFISFFFYNGGRYYISSVVIFSDCEINKQTNQDDRVSEKYRSQETDTYLERERKGRRGSGINHYHT